MSISNLLKSVVIGSKPKIQNIHTNIYLTQTRQETQEFELLVTHSIIT